MSLAITHFAFGALCATLLLAYLPVRTRYGFPLVVGSGVWAMLPDFWHVAPTAGTLFRTVGHSVLGNVFWLHPLLDAADPEDTHFLGAVMVGVYFLVSLVHAERRRDAPVFAVEWERLPRALRRRR
ncbi:hypothetical protein GCM10009037_24190 [Halarchaeum grantii]|uniref:LexA-binding, inner membrane-associated hydrolase n=1 Tax=Halarchaeum grantii TaxID=1193105 RepID=A0A830FEU8_9EURY|nr:hypothetical protein [Halarchaeum grantii]GGL39569.1 hypothetical protein GCM10009037_24190 [Halarchaeum grantii]